MPSNQVACCDPASAKEPGDRQSAPPACTGPRPVCVAKKTSASMSRSSSGATAGSIGTSASPRDGFESSPAAPSASTDASGAESHDNTDMLAAAGAVPLKDCVLAPLSSGGGAGREGTGASFDRPSSSSSFSSQSSACPHPSTRGAGAGAAATGASSVARRGCCSASCNELPREAADRPENCGCDAGDASVQAGAVWCCSSCLEPVVVRGAALRLLGTLRRAVVPRPACSAAAPALKQAESRDTIASEASASTCDPSPTPSPSLSNRLG